MLRRLVTTFALLAFVLQGFATQTHIHYLAQGTSAQTTALANAVSNRDHNPRAPSDDPLHCAFCQEFLLAGAFVAPAAIATPVPTEITTPVHAVETSFAMAEGRSHAWTSRGPPLA